MRSQALISKLHCTLSANKKRDSEILKVKNATQAVAERKPEKIQACGDSNHVLCCNGTGKDEDEITHIGIQILFI